MISTVQGNSVLVETARNGCARGFLLLWQEPQCIPGRAMTQGRGRRRKSQISRALDAVLLFCLQVRSAVGKPASMECIGTEKVYSREVTRAPVRQINLAPKSRRHLTLGLTKSSELATDVRHPLTHPGVGGNGSRRSKKEFFPELFGGKVPSRPVQ